MEIFTGAAPAPELVETMSGPEMEALMREMGFDPELTVDVGGDPMIRFMSEGFCCRIHFYNVENGRARNLQFSAAFSDKVPLEVVNNWNSRKRFIKAYLDSDGDICLNMDFELDGGVSRKHITECVLTWRSLFTSFLRFLRDN